MKVVLALLTVACIGLAGISGAADARPLPDASGRPTITLTSLDPWIGPNRTVTATLRITNAPRAATLRSVLHRAVTTRSGFEATTKGHNLTGVKTSFTTQKLTATNATMTVQFHAGKDPIETPPDAPPEDSAILDRPGVYPLVFSLNDSSDDEVASMVAYVVKLPDASPQGTSGREPLRVASQLRLSPRPALDTDGRLTVPATASRDTTALVDGLDGLSTTVRSSFGFTISPSFLDALADKGDNRTLRSLATLTDGLPLQSQPWSPVDPAGWLATPGLDTRLDQTTTQGDRVLTARLHAPDRSITDVAGWGGRISQASLEWFTDKGSTGLLIPEAALDPLDTVAFPRTLAAPFEMKIGGGRTIPAMQLDSALSAHFDHADPTLGANQLIADLSVIALDLPSIRRAMVVAPPVGWHPSKAFLSAYTAALTSAQPTGSDPLLAPTPIAELLSQTPLARADGDLATQGDPLTRSLRRSGAPAPSNALAAQLDRADRLIASTASLVAGGPTASVTTIEKLRRQAALIAMPGVTSARVNRQVDAIETEAIASVRSIRLPPRQTITLTSNTSSLPVTIRRPSSGPTRVAIHIDAPSRLHFPDGRSQLVQLDEPTTRLNIRVHSDSPGDSIVRLNVTSPDGRLDAGTTELVVRSTAASGVGFIISFGSLLFLVIWWGRDLIRGRRRRRPRRIPPAELIDIGTSDSSDV